MSLQIGQIIDDKYRIAGLIGEGGMGAVYEGENLKIRRRVAIKVLHADRASNADVVRRFEREAQAAGTIGNDHILEVLDLGALPGGERYMVMEFLDGEPLSARMKQRGQMSASELVPLLKQLLSGLAAAHGAGIVHRDLKPDNIFILKEKAGHRDYVKIIDFGISKFAPTAGDHHLTRTGTVMGTPYYMSPEQANGTGVADSRSDLYAIGVVLYEALTGHVPFEGATFNELLFKIVLSDVRPIQTLVSGVDPAFASIVTKAMARPVDQRFQTASEFIAALDNWTRTGAAVPPPVLSSPGIAPPNAVRQPSRATPVTAGAAGPVSIPGATGGDAARSVVQGRTQDSWAASQSQLLMEPKRGISAAASVAIAAAGLIAVAGVGFGAYKMLAGGNGTSASSATMATNVPAPTANSSQVAPPAPIAAPPVDSPAKIETPEPTSTAPSATPATKGIAHLPKPAPVAPPPTKAAKPAQPTSGHPAAKGSDQADLGY